MCPDRDRAAAVHPLPRRTAAASPDARRRSGWSRERTGRGLGAEWLKRITVKRLTAKRIALALLALAVGWVALSLVLFLLSSHFERVSPPANVASVLDPAGFPLTSANTILVLGSDRARRTARNRGPKPPARAARTRSC